MRELGFVDVETIDEDLGRSGSGLTDRPGFQRLVTEVCEGQIGAVFCLEASRLARNGRDWHHLIELCGLVGAVLIDAEGIYDPRVINDRLVLGLRGTMSEFEPSISRQRSVEAIRQKAKRGEFHFQLPVGLCWGATGKIEFDPDVRVQSAVRLLSRNGNRSLEPFHRPSHAYTRKLAQSGGDRNRDPLAAMSGEPKNPRPQDSAPGSKGLESPNES